MQELCDLKKKRLIKQKIRWISGVRSIQKKHLLMDNIQIISISNFLLTCGKHTLKKQVAILLILKQFASIYHIHVWEKRDRKSTRLNSSHVSISYAVFC